MQTTIASWKPLAASTRVPRLTTQRHAFTNIPLFAMPALHTCSCGVAPQRSLLTRASKNKMPIQAAQAVPARTALGVNPTLCQTTFGANYSPASPRPQHYLLWPAASLWEALDQQTQRVLEDVWAALASEVALLSVPL